MRRDPTGNSTIRLAICGLVVFAVMVVLRILPVPHDRLLSAGLNLFLVVVLVVSIRWGTRYAILVSLLSALAFSFSVPPAGHLHYDSRVVTLFTACLVSGVVAGQLSGRVRRAVVEARQAEAAARNSEQELRDAIETIPAMVWSANPDLSNAFINRRWIEYTGGSASGLAWQAALHPDDHERHLAKVRDCFAAGKPLEDEVRLRRADGEYRWFLVTGVPLHDQHGKIRKWYGIVTDIEHRRRGEEALRQSGRYLAEAQRLTHTGSFIWEAKTKRALYLSDEWYRIFGFESEHSSRDSAEDSQHDLPQILREERAWDERLQRIHPDDRIKWEEAVNQAIRDKSDYSLEFRVLLPGGARKYLQAAGHAVLDDSGEVVQFVGSVADITERKEAEEQREKLRNLEAEIARTNRITMMGELTASLAHEVNQPIAAAVTNSNTSVRWLDSESPNMDEARAAARRAAKDATRAAEIVNHIRSLFRKDAPQRELIQINKVINEMITLLLRTEADRYGISVRSELEPDLPEVMADRVQLQQVVLNLVINAIDAMKVAQGARILTLGSQLDQNSSVRVSVSDTGVGLPPDPGKIFEAFFTTKPHGTGMGLAISRTIIEAHGGRLWAETNPAGGSTFCFMLPTVVD